MSVAFGAPDSSSYDDAHECCAETKLALEKKLAEKQKQLDACEESKKVLLERLHPPPVTTRSDARYLKARKPASPL